VVRSVPEAEFDTLQVDYLRAFELFESDIGPHGFLMSEAVSRDADPMNKDRKFSFVADETPTVDFAAKARADMEDAYFKKWPDANRNGLFFPVRKVPV